MTKAIFFRVLCRKKYKFPKAERTMSYPHTHATRGKLQNFYLHNIFLVLQILLFHSLRFFFFFSFPILRWNFMHLVFDLRRIDGFLLGLFCYHKPNIFSFFLLSFFGWRELLRRIRQWRKRKAANVWNPQCRLLAAPKDWTDPILDLHEKFISLFGFQFIYFCKNVVLHKNNKNLEKQKRAIFYRFWQFPSKRERENDTYRNARCRQLINPFFFVLCNQNNFFSSDN